MKILFLSQRFVLPMDTGGKIRTGKLLGQLSRRHQVTLVSNVERPKDEPYLGRVNDLCERFVEVPWREPPRHSMRFLARVAFKSLSRYPVSVLNDTSAELRAAIDEALRAGPFDVAVCDFVQSVLNFRNVHGVPTLLFTHNVESMILERHATNATNPVSSLFWKLQWERMCRLEKQACHAFDEVVAVSEVDGAAFRDLYGAPNVGVIPTGVDVEFFTPGSAWEIDPNEIVFCGSMDWLPNEDAMTWFVEEILPGVRETVPQAHLTVVGRNPSPALERLARARAGVELTGWVDDTRPYLRRAAVFVVPIRVGGGTRMKIYEGMAMGKAVVSTTVGAEGLEYEPGEHLLVADDAASLARSIARLLTDRETRDGLGARAREHVAERFSWERVAAVFAERCEHAIRNHGPDRRMP